MDEVGEQAAQHASEPQSAPPPAGTPMDMRSRLKRLAGSCGRAVALSSLWMALPFAAAIFILSVSLPSMAGWAWSPTHSTTPAREFIASAIIYVIHAAVAFGVPFAFIQGMKAERYKSARQKAGELLAGTELPRLLVDEQLWTRLEDRPEVLATRTNRAGWLRSGDFLDHLQSATAYAACLADLVRGTASPAQIRKANWLWRVYRFHLNGIAAGALWLLLPFSCFTFGIGCVAFSWLIPQYAQINSALAEYYGQLEAVCNFFLQEPGAAELADEPPTRT